MKNSHVISDEKPAVVGQGTLSSDRLVVALPGENVVAEEIVQSLQKPVNNQIEEEGKVPKNQIPVLDGVRALACLAVLSWHLNQVTPALHGINNYLAALVYFGESGVVLFFLLSGFLLFLPYTKALLLDSPWPSAYRFYLRRIFRILPGYFVTLFLVVLFFHPEYMHPRFFLSALNFNLTKVVDPTFWTLAVEMLFYLFLPILAGVFRLVCRGTVYQRMLLLTFCLCVMAAWGMLSNYWGLYIAQTSQLEFLIPHALSAALLRIIEGDRGNFIEVFALGMFLCMVYTFTHYTSIGKRWGMRISRLAPLMWIGGLAVLAFMSLCHLYDAGSFVRVDSPDMLFPFLDPYGPALRYYWHFYQGMGYAIGYGLCMAAVLYGLGYVRRVFEWPIVRNLGTISFSLYLWHLPLLFLFVDAVAPRLLQYGLRHRGEYVALWCWAIAIILPVSIFLYRYVEKPGIRFGRWLEEAGIRVAMRLVRRNRVAS